MLNARLLAAIKLKIFRGLALTACQFLENPTMTIARIMNRLTIYNNLIKVNHIHRNILLKSIQSNFLYTTIAPLGTTDYLWL